MTNKGAKRAISREVNKKDWNPYIVKAILDDLLKKDSTLVDVPDEELPFIAARLCETTVAQMKSKSRVRKDVVARQLVYLELRNRSHTYMSIGDMFNRDHTTVVFHVKQLLSHLEIKVGYEYTTERYNHFNRLLTRKKDEIEDDNKERQTD